MAPILLSLRSGAPTAVKICPTERIYCSTLRLWMGLLLAVRTPVRTLLGTAAEEIICPILNSGIRAMELIQI